MQGKGLSLRLGLLALVVVLIFGAVGSLSLARDAFDDADYDDCPAGTRLDAVTGLTVDRTDEKDEIRISWDALDAAALSQLGTNGYLARLTVIVEGGGDDAGDPMNLALGETSLVVDDVTFTSELTVSVAVTQSDYVISDIREAEFTSGMPAPSFKTTMRVSEEKSSKPLEEDDVAVDVGPFYYLGFNDLFDNWYYDGAKIGANAVKPSTPKFRVGLVHGDGTVTPDDADFANYRITIEDSAGDLLGYQAETVAAKGTYDTNKIVFGDKGEFGTYTATAKDGKTPATAASTNIRLSNRVQTPALSPYYASAVFGANPFNDSTSLSFGNLTKDDLGDKIIYADPPVEYFDFPSNVFDADGNYTLKAWAEDDDGTRISPVASITVNVQEASMEKKSSYDGYKDDGETIELSRSFTGGEADLQVYQFSIQDE